MRKLARETQTLFSPIQQFRTKVVLDSRLFLLDLSPASHQPAERNPLMVCEIKENNLNPCISFHHFSLLRAAKTRTIIVFTPRILNKKQSKCKINQHVHLPS